MSHLRLVSGSAPRQTFGFNSRDLIALTCWMQQADAHGYRRVLIEGGTGGDEPEEGSYVLLYAPRRDWASWGLARSDDTIVVWHCGTGSDQGRYPSMLKALESLPPVSQRADLVPVQPPMGPKRFEVVHPV